MLDSPAVVTWKYRDAEKYGSYEAISSGDLIVPSKYWPEDEWFEITGRRGFFWVNRCTSMLLDKPPLTVYTGEEGRRVRQFCRAIQRTARENREVKLDEIINV
jgi:hypothetical protein